MAVSQDGDRVRVGVLAESEAAALALFHKERDQWEELRSRRLTGSSRPVKAVNE